MMSIPRIFFSAAAFTISTVVSPRSAGSSSNGIPQTCATLRRLASSDAGM